MSMKIDRRQFLIGPRPLVKENWLNIVLNEKQFLSYSDELPVYVIERKNKKRYILIGNAVQTNHDQPNPLKSLQLHNDNSIEKLYMDWSGRWVLLTENELHMDCCGLLGCFYIKKNEEVWISSSINVLKQVVKLKKHSNSELPEGTMNWYALPDTEFHEVKALLPSQVIQYRNMKIKARELLTKELFIKSDEDAIEILTEKLITGIKNLHDSNKGKTIWVPLSAGYDSRLLLAIALKAKIPFKTYTFRKKNRWYFFRKIPGTSPVSKADMYLPELISNKVNIQHKWVEEQELNFDKLNRFTVHSSNRVIENDRVYYSRGQWDWCTENDIILLGQVTGVGVRPYYNRFIKSKDKINLNLLSESFMLKQNSINVKSMKDYITWLDKYNALYADTINWRDRFYIEQRFGGWLSSGQQALDLVEGEKIHLANSHRILGILLSFSEEQYTNKEFIKRIIYTIKPELLDIPINPKEGIIYSFNKKISNISKHPSPVRFVIRKIREKLRN